MAQARKAHPVLPRGTAKDTVAWLPAERTQFLIECYGNATKLAQVLGVTKSQPSRWKRGLERPGLEAAQRLLDLDHVLARAQLLWEPDVALTWLESPNAFLDNARPIDVALTQGAGDVLEAIDAALEGAYS